MAAEGRLTGVTLGLLFQIVFAMGAAFGEEPRRFVQGEENVVLKENSGGSWH